MVPSVYNGTILILLQGIHLYKIIRLVPLKKIKLIIFYRDPLTKV